MNYRQVTLVQGLNFIVNNFEELVKNKMLFICEKNAMVEVGTWESLCNMESCGTTKVYSLLLQRFIGDVKDIKLFIDISV